MHKSQPGNTGGIDRREFLLLTAAGTFAAMSPFSLYGESHEEPAPARHSLLPLAPGAVRAEGWLHLYLERQARELGSQLPQVSWPFTEAYWAGEEKAESWWPWEQCAYWIDGAARLALVLDDEQLMSRVRVPIDYTLAHPSEGYLGPRFFSDPKGDFHRWPHAIFFRAFAALADAGKRSDLAEAMRRHYLSDQANYGEPIRNVINIESILWCYQATGDAKLLALAEKSWQEYLKVAGDHEHGDLGPMRVFAATTIEAHGVTYIETAKQPAILYLHTGKPEYLKYALAAQRRIFDHHMLVDGIPSTTEDYRARTSLDSHETCDIVDHLWSWGYLLRATGSSLWADRMERALFNAGMGAIKKDWRALQYFSSPNQFLATLNSDHNELIHGGRLMAYQPNPGQNIACCGGNVHRMLPNYVMGMWMKTGQEGLAAVLYGPSRVKTTVGSERRTVEIEAQTDFPFGERIDFAIRSEQPVKFPLLFRIPGWCAAPRLELNGRPIEMPRPEQGFATLAREFHPDDRITLTLPMQCRTSRWPQNGIAIEHGPLVFSLPVEAEWTPVVEAKYTTPEYPSWNAVPTSRWNYGLSTQSNLAELDATLERAPMTSDPWVNPPLHLSVPARKLESWQLQNNPADEKQKFTPPLPEEGERISALPVERLKLVPYGATHLRLTLFPELSEQNVESCASKTPA